METQKNTEAVSEKTLNEVEGIFASVYDMPLEQRRFHAAMYQDVIQENIDMFDALNVMTDNALSYDDVLASSLKSTYHQMGAVLQEKHGRAVGRSLLAQGLLQFHAASLLCARTDLEDEDIAALKTTEAGILGLFVRRKLTEAETEKLFAENPEITFEIARRWDSIPSIYGQFVLKELLASFNNLHRLETRTSCSHFTSCMRKSNRTQCPTCWPVREKAGLCLSAAQKIDDAAAAGELAKIFYLIPFSDLTVAWVADVMRYFGSVSLEVPYAYASKILDHYLKPYFSNVLPSLQKKELSIAEREDVKEEKNAFTSLVYTMCALNIPNSIYWTKIIAFLATTAQLRAMLPELGKMIQDNEAFPRKLSGNLRDIVLKSL